MTAIIAGSTLTNAQPFERSSDFTVSSTTFLITCDSGAVRLLLKVGSNYYGLSDVYEAPDYPSSGVARAPQIPVGNALTVTTLAGETYALQSLDPNTNASAYNL